MIIVCDSLHLQTNDLLGYNKQFQLFKESNQTRYFTLELAIIGSLRIDSSSSRAFS